MLSAISSVYFKKEILYSAYDKQLDVVRKRRVIVCVNAFQPEGASKRKVQVLPKRLQRERVGMLTVLKRRRDLGSVQEKLELLRSAAEAKENMLPAISAAVGTGCTVGEISGTLREVYGVYKPRQPV